MRRLSPRRSDGAGELAGRDGAIVRAVEDWFGAHARDLPWRRVSGVVDGVPRRDPYRALVSELMLQQTQVARVVERFQAFIERFPRVADLASADEQEVLALWSGLGYYRRARLLHAAAREVVSRFGAVFPSDPGVLSTLPGVGRYTAGAVASMALGERTPVVDGNVTRVLLRLDAGSGGLPRDAVRTGDKRAEAWAWRRAGALVALAEHPGRFNEGLMELGAVVCTPASAHCDACPLAKFCAARAAGVQEAIPGPKRLAERKPLYCASVIIRDAGQRIAVERRPARGMWAGLWQAPTLESGSRRPSRAAIFGWIMGTARPGKAAPSALTRIGTLSHTTTHRDVRFDVWEWEAPPPRGPEWSWKALEEVGALPLSSIQRRILTMAGASVPHTISRTLTG